MIAYIKKQQQHKSLKGWSPTSIRKLKGRAVKVIMLSLKQFLIFLIWSGSHHFDIQSNITVVINFQKNILRMRACNLHFTRKRFGDMNKLCYTVVQ